MQTFEIVTVVLSLLGMALNFWLLWSNRRQLLLRERINEVLADCALMAFRMRGSPEMRRIYLENLEAEGRRLGLITKP